MHLRLASCQAFRNNIGFRSPLPSETGIANLKRNLSLSESDGLEFPLKIRYQKGGGGVARRKQWAGGVEGENFLHGGAIKILETRGVKF